MSDDTEKRLGDYLGAARDVTCPQCGSLTGYGCERQDCGFPVPTMPVTPDLQQLFNRYGTYDDAEIRRQEARSRELVDALDALDAEKLRHAQLFDELTEARSEIERMKSERIDFAQWVAAHPMIRQVNTDVFAAYLVATGDHKS